MAAAFHTVGPVEMYIRPRVEGVSASTFYYLGTAQTSPETDVKVAYNPVLNDLGGRLVSSQDVYDGEVHTISFTLTRFNWQTYNRLRVAQAGPTILLHGDGAIERGRLVRGVSDHEFLMVNSYSGTVADPTNDVPRGRLYYHMKPLAFRESRTGTRVEEITCMLECHAQFDAPTRGWNMFTEQSAFWSGVVPE